jgi:hypothetical protein
MGDVKKDSLNQELDDLFLRYRDACPGAAPSASFMPGVWERIERRRQSRFRLMHVSRIFLSGATALWLLLAGFLLLPPSAPPPVHHQSYVDALAAGHDSETFGLTELAHQETGELELR